MLATCAAIGASHEIFEPGRALEAMVARRLAIRQEIERRRARHDPYPQRAPLERTPLLRSIDGGIDDTKFLYPVLDNLPLIVFPVLSYTLAGLRVGVYGPPEVGRVLEVLRSCLLRDGLLEDGGRIVFVEEDRSAVSIHQSFRRSTEAVVAGPGEAVVWSAGDLVLAYDTFPWLMDRHIPSHDLIFNLNARQVVFPPGTPELFARSYLDSMRLDGDPGLAVDVKEPNVLIFTLAGLQGLGLIEEIRRPKAGETYVGRLVRAAGRSVLEARPAATFAFLRYGFKRGLDRLDTCDGVAQRHLVELASVVFGVPTMVKADNTDPFFVKDCDSLEDLFGYYRTILQSIVDSAASREDGYRELQAYYPYADVLYRLSLALRPLTSEIPLWRHWPQILQDKIATCNNRLRTELQGLGLASQDPPVPEYFDSRGSFQPRPGAGDDIPRSKDFLRGAYRTAFEEHRESFRELASQLENPF